MPAFGLHEYLNRRPTSWPDPACELFQLHDEFYAPGFWVSVAALGKAAGVRTQDVAFPHERLRGYAETIGLQAVLDGSARRDCERHKLGMTYSPLVLLESAEATNQANGVINDCIRNIFPENELSWFVKNLCEVVGDLHDNVWSHGESTGFSMAQRWKKPYTRDGSYFEFALADCGQGFLREVRRVGLPIDSHRAAIDWCIVKGNSSKKLKKEDPFAQRLPPDAMGNPMGAAGRIVTSENNHMGLGLWKLTELVRNYSGQMWLASGNDVLYMQSNVRTVHHQTRLEWPGVALACRFETGSIKGRQPEAVDDVTEALAQLLGDDHER